MFRHTYGNNRGSTFLTTMICVMLMSLIGGYMYQTSAQNSHYINEMRRSTQAQMIAEAGLAKALSTIRNNWSAISGGWSTTTLGSGSYLTSVSSSGGRYLVKTVGTVQNHSRTVSAEVKAPNISALSYVFAAGAVTPSIIDTGTGQSGGSITGDIYAAGPLTLDGGTGPGSALTVTGNAYSASTVTTSSGATVTGSTNQSYSPTVNFPTVDFSYYQAIAAANGQDFTPGGGTKTYASGTLTTPAGHVVFVHGDVVVNGTQDFNGTLVATGNISVAKTGSTYPQVTMSQYSNYPALLTQNGNISYTSVGNGDAYWHVTGLVYSGNNFTISSGNHDDFSFTGSILARGKIDTSGMTAQNSTFATYVSQSPPGFTSTNTSASIISYNQ